MWLALFTFALAAGGDHLPLDGADELVYSDGAATVRTAVTATYAQHWRQHDSFAGLGPQWVRGRPGSTEYRVYDAGVGEQVLFDSSAPVGARWVVDLDPCNHGPVVLAERGLTVTTPAGTFDDVIRLALRPSCADAGLTELLLAPGVGVVGWTAETVAGPVTWELLRGRVGDLILPKPFGVQVSASFEHAEVWVDMMPPVPPGGPAPIPLRAALRVHNGTSSPVAFTFPTSQRFDVHVIDAAGQVVASWSDGKAFLQVTSTETLDPGDTWAWDGAVLLVDRRGAPLPPGEYTVRIEQRSVGKGQPAAEAPLSVGWAF